MSKTINLSTVRIRLSADDIGPKWNTLFLAGDFYRHDFPGGKVTVTRANFEQMIQNWKRAGALGLPIDRFHWGDSSDTRVSADDKDAVGFIEDLRIDADGNLEGLTNWNATGRSKILEDKLRYFSPSFLPEFHDSKTGKPQGFTLFGGGLLNDPFLTNLPRMAASLFPSTNQPPGAKPKDHKMDFKKLLCALFSLPETATDEEVMGKVQSSQTAQAAATQMAAKLEGEKLDLSRRATDNETALKLAQKSVVDLSERVKSLETEKSTNEITALEEKLVLDRHILPAQREDVRAFALAQGTEKARVFFSKLPKVTAGNHTEVGVPPAGEDTPATAKLKLSAAVEELVKKDASLKRSQATRMAAKANPELAALANKAV